MKKVFFSALLMGFAAVSFAGTPKSDTKPETFTAPSSQDDETLVWYKVVYDASHPNGYIPSGSTIIYNGDATGAEGLGICPTGLTYDCLRGFSSAPALPTNAMGSDQVKTSVKP